MLPHFFSRAPKALTLGLVGVAALAGCSKAPTLEQLRAEAARGRAKAQCALGAAYASGKGMPVDYVQAREWFEKAAVQGLPAAEGNLGILYERGLGTPADHDQARKWYRKAADDGSVPAQAAYASLLLRDKAGEPGEALKWYEKAAARHFVPAMLALGDYAYFGDGGARDYAQARAWYQKAADWGSSIARNNLGVIYESGLGVAKDPARAAALFRQAAEDGEPKAQGNLGRLYMSGQGGLARDPVEAYKWLLLARRQGEPIGGRLALEFGAGLSAEQKEEAKARADRFAVALDQRQAKKKGDS